MIDNLGMVVYFHVFSYWMPQCFIDAPQYYSLVMTNIAIENGPFPVGYAIKMDIVHSHVNLPEDNQDHVLKRWDPKWGQLPRSSASPLCSKPREEHLLGSLGCIAHGHGHRWVSLCLNMDKKDDMNHNMNENEWTWTKNMKVNANQFYNQRTSMTIVFE